MKMIFLRVTSLLLSLVTYSFAQAPIGTDDICQREQGISDNLSCPRADEVLQCYPRSQLCNGVEFCDDGSDEGTSLNALDCTGQFTGRTTDPIPAFVCGAGVIVELDQLCDGVNDCGGGDDETTALCENKCLEPYYGSCPLTRECVSTDLDVNCGLCLPGFARNPAAILGDCLSATFTFSLTSFSVVENNGPLTGSVRLDTVGQIDQEILVVVQTVAMGTATVNADYTPIVSTLTFTRFSGGGTEVQFEVPILDDAFCEGSETFDLSATIVDNLGVFAAGGDSATGVIIDNDQCSVGFEQMTYTTMEGVLFQEVCLVPGGGQLATDGCEIEVSLSQTAVGDVPSGKSSANVGAVSPDAELNTPITFTFGPSRSTRQCLNLNIVSDSITEGGEVFQVLATSNTPNLCSAGPNEAQVCIQGEEIEFAFSQSIYDVNENAVLATVTIELVSGLLTVPTVIDLATNDGMANSNDNLDAFNNFDYTATSTSVTFPAGASAGASMSINIPINDDIFVEQAQEGFMVLASSTNPDVLFPSGTSAIVRITDNDVPMFQFTSPSYFVQEDMGPATVSVELFQSALTFPIAVSVIDVAGGSASDGIDYIGVNAVLNFAAGSQPGAEESFTIPITNDLFDEPQENIILEGDAAAPGLFPQNQAQVFINDDDVCRVGLEQATYDVVENAGTVEVCLAKRNAVQLTGPVDVLLSTGPAPATQNKDPATAGLDFTPQNLVSITFSQGVNRMCVNIPITDDILDERTENFLVTVTSNNPASIDIQAGEGSAEVCIQDDDLSEFAFSQSVYTTEEGQPIVQACIDLVQGSLTRAIPITVSSVAGGTATEINDYSPIDVTVTFPSGSAPGAQQCFDLPIIDDFIVENTEFYLLSASSTDPQATFTAGGNSARVNIIDNDRVPIRIVPPPGLGVPNFEIPESDGPLEVCVEINDPFNLDHLEKSVTVTLSSVATGSAQAGADYGPINQLITFTPANQGQQLCVNIPITNDIICEGDETFSIQLSSDDDCVTLEMPSQGTVTIMDDDVASIGPDNGIIEYNVTERLDDAVWIPIRLTGQKGPGRQCEVEVRTMDGTATAGMDYTSLTSTLTFDNSNELQMVHIDILNDDICEGHETFTVALNTMSDGCQISDSLLTVWIWDDEVHFGDDPHFSIALPGGKLLCYTVQGEHGFSFNLISNDRLVMNSKFVPDARRPEVTWLGSMGIIVQDSKYKGSNSTKLRFEALEKNIYIGDKISLQAKNIEKLTFSNGKLTISEAPPATHFRYPSVMVDLQDVEISFTIKFTNQHLDMYWHSTGKKITDSHGLIGQFFRDGVEIDEIRKILIMPNKEPVPVMRRPVWAFMEREEKDDQLCWTAMNPGYQGEGLIDGTYFDYLVDDVMSTRFKFNKQ